MAYKLLADINNFSPDSIKNSYSMPLNEMIQNSNQNLLRIIHYPPLMGEENPSAIRAGAHEDINLITLLVAGSESGLQVLSNDGDWVDVSTSPFPGFPTDLQPQLMSVLGLAEGTSTIMENVFENRFMHAPELNRMGANILIKGRKAVISGVKEYRGVPVMASDLRAAASLVLAGLAAEGKTIIDGLHHLDRGYQKIESKLAKCGVNIYRAD